MIESITLEGEFKAVPYLCNSLLMSNHPDGVKFSTKKPNVIVGPNGAGKSALMKTLALSTLSNQTGQSALDGKYLEYESETLWSNDWGYDCHKKYGKILKFLPGVSIASDNGPALYFRANHIPGNNDMIAEAMMCGYFEEAKAYGQATRQKSSGQKTQALLERIQRVLGGKDSVPDYSFQNWRMKGVPYSEEEINSRYWSGEDRVRQANYLMARVDAAKSAMPVILMDEPEQSLDARAEMVLWRTIGSVNSSSVQLIIATHSLYSILFPEKFNIIEAVPGYINEVKSLMG